MLETILCKNPVCLFIRGIPSFNLNIAHTVLQIRKLIRCTLEEKNAIWSDSSADLFSYVCQHEHKGLLGESKVRPYILWQDLVFSFYYTTTYTEIPHLCKFC